MRVFDFDPADHSPHYREHGWVHIPGGVSSEFLAVLQEFTARRFESHRVEGKAIAGAKEQALFEFSPEVDFPGELFDVVSEVAGLNRGSMTLAERHIKAYDPDAAAEPLAHKDRYASQCSVGLSIDIPEESRLVLYPSDRLDRNPFNVSAAYPRSLDPDDRPGKALGQAREVVIDDSPGDVMMFPGASVWHLRRNPANATNLYLKFNDFDCDPLGEDPSSVPRREETLEVLAGGDGSLDGLVPVLARRLDTFTRQYTRDWEEVLLAQLWEADPVRLTEEELSLLRAVDGRTDAGTLLSGSGVTVADLLRLGERGVIDLVRPPG